MKIAIIGGGISGLTTAYYIKKQRPNVEIVIYESKSNLGGKMNTANVNGFRFEEGSNGFLSNKPDTFKFIEDIGANELVEKSNDNARKRFVYKDKLYQFPTSPKDFLTTGLISPFAKIRVGMEYFIKPKLDDTDESVQDFGYRRLGRGFTNNFLDAMTNGIFAANSSDLSLKAAFPVIANLEKEYGGLFKGMIARKKGGAPSGVLMSFKQGVSTFIEHIENNIDAKIIKDCTVSKVTDTGNSFVIDSNVGKFSASKVVFTTPSFVTADLIKDDYEDLSNSLMKIPYSPVAVVGLGYDELEDELDGFGLLTTKSANLDILGILWDSSIFEDRAPINKKALRILIGGSRSPELALKSEKELVQIAKDGVKTCMGIETQPDTVFVKKYRFAIPRYELGHTQIVEEIFSHIKDNNHLFLGGNAFYGVGLNDCVANSMNLANDVVDTIKE
jgi:oxygen-dependent protoporphyrinogen oxidase